MRKLMSNTKKRPKKGNHEPDTILLRLLIFKAIVLDQMKKNYSKLNYSVTT